VRNLALHRVFVAATAAGPAAALAHTGLGDSHDLVHGFMHPLTGIDHVLAMVAVGVIAAQLGGRALWAVPLSFVATMAIAAIIGMVGLALPGLEAGIALSVIVLGAVISLRVRMSVILAVAIVAVFAVFHGYSHGIEMGDARSGVAFGLGFVAATALLHLTGISLGVMVGRIGVSRSQRIAQVSGGVIALVGVGLLAGSFS
jgi:urease accessory protein